MKNVIHGDLSQIKPAGSWERFWAFIIDALIISTPILIVGIFNYYNSHQFKFTLANENIWANIFFIITLTYYVYLTVNKGATWGKSVYGLKVVKYKTTRYINYKTAIIRELVKIMPGVSFIPIVGSLISFIILPIDIFFVLCTKEKRTIHDRIAGTQVIKAKDSWTWRKKLLIFLPYIILLIALSYRESTTYYNGQLITTDMQFSQGKNTKREINYPILDFVLQGFGKPNPNSIPPEVAEERKKLAQIAQENNKRRRNDVNLILGGVYRYMKDHNGTIPDVITSTEQEINKERTDLCSFLVPTYLSALPNDPQVRNRPPVEDCTSSYSTGYSIFKDQFTNKITVKAEGTELQEMKIEVTR
ncbi:MAG: RDD family protein [Candidatus Levybacteria bacterium]|nr:RDD family protein [Candidatus Levybacteria bacterium]